MQIINPRAAVRPLAPVNTELDNNSNQETARL